MSPPFRPPEESAGVAIYLAGVLKTPAYFKIEKITTMNRLLCLLLLGAKLLSAQSATDGSALIQAFSDRMTAVSKGSFTISSQFKFADEEDTLAHGGVCYFFKNELNADSLAHFVVFRDDKPAFAYDGERFYWTVESSKTISVRNLAALGGAQRAMGGNIILDNLIYKNLLYHGRPALRPSGFDTTVITAYLENNRAYLRLTLRDTTVETALGDVANNKIISAFHWDFAVPEFYLARFTGSVWLFDGWQYERKEFSAVQELPANAVFRDYFDPEKLASEYRFEDYDPNAPVKREVELIKKGDKLPDFVLNDLNGNAFSSKEQKKGLLLLDFWYKGCYPCQLAMPTVEALHQEYGAKGLKVLGINPFDKNPQPLQEWLAMRKVTYGTLLDPDKMLPKAVGITGYPLLIIADAKTKKVLYVHTGYSEEMKSELEPVIKAGLK
jgi:thiol-disulfide isomerase/thioredoxin